MKNFVFNFISGDKKKFRNGAELFNLIATCVAFDQRVTIILNENEDNMNFLLDVLKIPGKKDIVTYKKTLFGEISNYEGFRIKELSEVKVLIEQSDFYLEC